MSKTMNSHQQFSSGQDIHQRGESSVHSHLHSQQQEEHLRELKKQVELTRSQLLQLIQTDSFAEQAGELNRKAVEMMHDGQVNDAGILLIEAQKILQYAANRGKQINRNLIVAVLHNEACCHQQSWSLQRCSNYVQALIYNLNCEMKQTENESQRGLVVAQGVGIKRSLAQYYLLFCAINSQLKRNDAALIAAKKANSMLRISSSILARMAVKARMGLDQNIVQIFQDLGRLKSSAEGFEVQFLLDAAKYYLTIWKNKCSFPNFQLRNLIQKLKEYSIGNVMQMQPMSVQGCDRTVWNELTYQKVLERVVIMSMSYFTMATQLRLLAIRLGGGKEQAKLLSQYRQSQCYHLISIILIVYYLPFDLLYLQHILSSFSNHYLVDLESLPSPNSNINPQSLFTLLLDPIESKLEFKGSTAGNSSKEHSSGISCNSFDDKINQNINQLQSYVRTSLKGQQPQGKGQLAKLNNYYYVRGQFGNKKQKSKSKNSKHHPPHSSRGESLKKRACLTSKQSTQKTPTGCSPGQLSPKKSKNLSKESKSNLSSKRGSIGKGFQTNRSQKMSDVMEEYFNTDYNIKPKAPLKKQRIKLKLGKSKQNKDSLSSSKLKSVHSNEKLNWKAHNITNKINAGDRKIKEGSQIKTLKSPGKLRSKLLEAKSKKKPQAYPYI